MTATSFAVIDSSVNIAVFSALPVGFLLGAPFKPVEDDGWDSYIEAQYRGGLIEWNLKGEGRFVIGDARLPREFLPRKALDRAIRAVPLPPPLRLGFALARKQAREDKHLDEPLRRDTDFRARHGNLLSEWSIELGGTRDGWFEARVAGPRRWCEEREIEPYPHHQPAGTVIFKTKTLDGFRPFLKKLNLAEVTILRKAAGTASTSQTH